MGAYTEQLGRVHGRAQGILHIPYEERAGVLSGKSVSTACRNPSWLALNRTGDRAYAVNEIEMTNGLPAGTVSAFRYDRNSGVLTALNRAPSGGDQPCHLALDPSGRFLLVPHYGDGSVAVLSITSDGAIGEQTALVRHEGRGADSRTQAGPHAHQAVFDPLSGDVLVPDLGLDAVLVYSLDAAGRLTRLPDRTITTAAGAGPRHLAFHPGGNVLFMVNELDSTVGTYRREGHRFACVGGTSTVPPHWSGRNAPSGIRVTDGGEAVLVANRGHDSVAVLHFDPATDVLRPATWTPVAGREPRDLVLSPDGHFVHVASQDSGTIDTFSFDGSTFRLTSLGSRAVPTPACLVFA